MEHKKSKTEVFKDWLQILALIIAAIWAGYTFWFEKILEPSKYPSFLTFKSEITQVSEIGNNNLYKLKISILNKSKSRESLLASWFEIDACKLMIDTTISNEKYVQEINSQWYNKPRFPRYTNYDTTSYKVVNTGKLLNEHVSLHPDQEFTQEFLTLIPKGIYHEIRLRLGAITAKDDQDMKVYWFRNSDGSGNPSIITGKNYSDTITLENFLNYKDQLHQYFKKYDLSYTFNENEYALGFEK